MLHKLTIQNVALVTRAEIVFSAGVNVLSGETGAGKSVILDAIDFVLGAKADRSMIRSGENFCMVRAEFLDAGCVAPLLEEFDIETDETLILSRKFTSDGKSALKVNGCSVTAGMLRRITALLVDVHGQSEHFFLLKEANQMKLLDDVAGAPVAKIKARLSELLAARRRILADREKLGGDEADRARRLDILQYQIDEIGRAELKEGEEEELAAFRERWRNAERIAEALGAVQQYLGADGGSADALRMSQRALSSGRAVRGARGAAGGCRRRGGGHRRNVRAVCRRTRCRRARGGTRRSAARRVEDAQKEVRRHGLGHPFLCGARGGGA